MVYLRYCYGGKMAGKRDCPRLLLLLSTRWAYDENGLVKFTNVSLFRLRLGVAG